MKYLLDTNICIAWLNGERAVRDRLLAERPDDVATSAVVRAELTYGALAGQRAAANSRKLRAFWSGMACIPVDDTVADECGALRAELRRLGAPIGPNDLFIAATARTHDLVLATRNVREFGHVPGLQLERW